MLKNRSRRAVVRFVPALVTAVAISAVFVDAAEQLRFPRSTPQDSYSRADAQFVAQRLYRATLAREGDARGLEQATSEIQKGNLQKQVEAMTTSPEFLRTTNTLQPAVILEQFYRGLFDRSPDPAGVAAFTTRIQMRQYSSVLLEMLRSPEFRAKYGTPPKTGGPAGPANTRLEAALDCQSRVIDAVRRDAPGLVFLTFDNRLPETSPDLRVVSGPAVDRFDGDRHLNYRCEGTVVTYSYEDGAPARGADSRLQFPSAAVRNCQAAATGARSLTHDGAALSKSDTSTEYVLGVAVDRDNGQTVRFTCEMDVLRVVNIRMR